MRFLWLAACIGHVCLAIVYYRRIQALDRRIGRGFAEQEVSAVVTVLFPINDPPLAAVMTPSVDWGSGEGAAVADRYWLDKAAEVLSAPI